MIESYSRNWTKLLRQHEIVMSDHSREVSSLRKQAEEGEEAAANNQIRLETNFCWFLSLEQLVGGRPAAFGQFLEGCFQTFSSDLRKSLAVPYH